MYFFKNLDAAYMRKLMLQTHISKIATSVTLYIFATHLKNQLRNCFEMSAKFARGMCRRRVPRASQSA